jgi:hypothetical protein
MPAGSIVDWAGQHRDPARINTYANLLQLLYLFRDRTHNTDRDLIHRIGVTDDPLKRTSGLCMGEPISRGTSNVRNTLL